MLEDPKRFPKAECVGCSRSTGFTWLFQWLYSWGKGNKRWVDRGAEGRNRIVAYMLHLRNFFFWVCGNASPTKQVTSWAKVRGRDPDLSLQTVVLKWSLQCCFMIVLWSQTRVLVNQLGSRDTLDTAPSETVRVVCGETWLQLGRCFQNAAIQSVRHSITNLRKLGDISSAHFIFLPP